MQYQSRILGTGSYLPSRTLTNSDLEKTLDTTDAWIRERTGIRQRHVAAADETLCSISTTAAKIAMAEAGVTAAEIDAIVFGTCSPDKLLPATAVELQAALGATRAAAFDINAACSSWLYGMQLAEGLLAAGNAETVLVMGGEILSRIVNWKDRNTCVLFGDGAGATVVRRSTRHRGILSAYMRSDGTLAKLLYRPAVDSDRANGPSAILTGHLEAHGPGGAIKSPGMVHFGEVVIFGRQPEYRNRGSAPVRQLLGKLGRC